MNLPSINGLAGLAVGAGLLASTFLWVKGSEPEPEQHQEVVSALLTILIDSAKLQRDVLQARTGLLRSYDPLNSTMRSLRHSAEKLRLAQITEARRSVALIDAARRQLADAITAKEEVLEQFKSNNALAQNSLQIFSYAIQRIGTEASDLRLAAHLGQIALAMLRYVNDPTAERRNVIASSLDGLETSLPIDETGRGVRNLVSHGRIVLASLPVAGELAAELQNSSISDTTRALQVEYLEAHGIASRNAAWLRTLLYAAAVALSIYAAVLVYWLRVGAETLKRRVALEQAVGAISSQFVPLPPDQISEGITYGLSLLGSHFGADEIHVVAGVEAPEAPVACHWPLAGPERSPEELLALIGTASGQQPGAVAKARGTDLRHIRTDQDGRSWYTIGLDAAGSRLGQLVFATRAASMSTKSDGLILLDFAAQTFGNALHRAAGERARQDLEVRLAQAQRLDSLGTLAGGIAHEFNNILGAILGHAELASASLRRGSATRRHIEQIRIAGSKAQTVIDKVLTFGRRKIREDRLFLAADVIEEALTLIGPSLPGSIELRKDLARDAILRGDSTELEQVVMNLCLNAAHAMGARGAITLRLQDEEFPAARNLSHGRLRSGRYLRLEVNDTGSGIDPATLKRLFEPFFTTKAVGEGTGLGLSTVHGIVTAWGGAMNVVSRVGIGTSVQAYLPVAEASVVEAEDATLPAHPRGDGETVLLVAGDRRSRLSIEELLAALGYEPVGFEAPETALAAVQSEPERFSIALLESSCGTRDDLLVRRLRFTCPGLPILRFAGTGQRDRRPEDVEMHGAFLRSSALADSLARGLGKLRQDSAKLARPYLSDKNEGSWQETTITGATPLADLETAA